MQRRPIATSMCRMSKSLAGGFVPMQKITRYPCSCTPIHICLSKQVQTLTDVIATNACRPMVWNVVHFGAKLTLL